MADWTRLSEVRLLSGWRVIAGVLVAVVVLAGCGAATQSSAQQRERLRKAAGVAVFRINCTKDLWVRTGGEQGRGEIDNPIPAKVVDEPGPLITVQLTGPNLVDLLIYLNQEAHPGWATGPVDPLALRMYNAIAPKVDAIQPSPQPSGAPVPTVTIDDAVATTNPSPTSTTSETG